jgi:hypothetical protein
VKAQELQEVPMGKLDRMLASELEQMTWPDLREDRALSFKT